MAASAPAPSVQPWANDGQSTKQNSNTNSLEMGMTGMSLVSGYPGVAPKRKETGSTFSSSPDDREDSSSQQMASGTDRSGSNTAPASPIGARQVVASGIARPPGMNGQLPSPIGKPGHSKNNSATSPLLTLTPNSSSADGNSDWHSLGRQSSPFHGSDGPSMPNLQQPEHRRGEDGLSNFGSFDLNADNDGLLGLQALRDRAHSSPGPAVEGVPSSSPSGMRGHFSAHFTGESAQDRSRSRERPPLPQPAAGENSSVGGGSLPYSTTSSTRSVTDLNMSMESTDSRFGFGAIARPELRPVASDFDPTRRRASSSGDFHNPYSMQVQQHQMQQQQQQQGGYVDPNAFSQKFGSLPTLGTHIQQQRVPVNPPENYGDFQRPRHVRSVSQPMPPNQQQQHYPPGMQQMDARYMPAPPAASRSTSMSHPTLSSSYEAPQYAQKMASMPNMTQGYDQYPSLQRRDALDFHLSPNTQGSGSYNQGMGDPRGYGQAPSMISPGQSPMAHHYGGHSRQPSDGSNMMSTSSHMSHNPGYRGQQGGHMHGRQDDDLAHPLAGEHIEVPDEHSFGGYGGQQGGGHPLMRNSGHGHSMSLDQLPSPYHDPSHRMDGQGQNMPAPAPKVIYNIKFKRTQRNFVLGPRISRDLKIGTYVKVEADRGEDLGIVIGKAPADKYNFPSRSSFSAGMGPPGGLGGAGAADLKRIMRLATHDEVSLLTLKREEEDELLKICRTKVRQRSLPMHVVDAEYQFDRHKLTFFFEAEGRVDFRELVRDLFSMYKTRIWMQQLDKNTSTIAQAILAPQTANMQMDYGTPIIAPTSEFADVVGNMSGSR